MESTSDYAGAATVSPIFEFLSLATLGFTWIYFGEWNSVPGAAYSALLLAPIASLTVGVLHWYGLWRELPRVAMLTLMHGVTELISFLAGGTALAFFLFFCLTDPPAGEMDARVLDELIVSGIFALMGSGFGLVVFLFVLPVSRAQLKAAYREITSG